MKKFLLQQNIWNEYSYIKFVQAFDNQAIPYEMVNVIPFTDKFDIQIDFIPVGCFGSNRFINLCREKGYPVFKSFDPIETFYGVDNWVNGEGYDTTWSEFSKTIDFSVPKFIKPYTEKFFTGKVIESAKDIERTQLTTSFIGDPSNEKIRVSNAVNIRSEIRFFIIQKKIISASYYKIGGQVKYKRVDPSDEVFRYLQMYLDLAGYIDDAFVLDLADISSADERPCWHFVELNNINSAGFYDCDAEALVRAFNIAAQ